jgi:uncharacterized protein (DUF58 family)
MPVLDENLVMAARGLAAGFTVIGTCILAMAGYYHFATPSGPAVRAETEIPVADCVAGQKLDVVLRLHNQSGRPVRVLGLTMC